MTDPAPSDDLLAVTTPSPASPPPADPTRAARIDAALAELAECGVNFNNFYSLANQNKAFVLAAVRGDETGERFKNTTAAFKADKDIAIAAVTASLAACEHVAEALWDDKDVVLAAVTTYGKALHRASDRLKDDRDVVLTALKENGFALGSASERLRNDEEIVLAAVMESSASLSQASDEVRKNAAFVERAANELIAAGKGYAPWFDHETAWLHQAHGTKIYHDDDSPISNLDVLLEKSLLTTEEKTAILGRLPMTFLPNPVPVVGAVDAEHRGLGLNGGTPPAPSTNMA